MRRAPLLGAALLLAAGIALGPYLLPWRLPLALAAIAGGAALAAWYWWRRTLPAPLAFFLIAAVGMLLVAPPVPAATAARVTGVRGWFDGEVLARSGRIFQGARLAAWRLGNGPWTAPGRTLRLWVGGAPGGVSAGRRFTARGRLYPSAAAGAGGFFHPKRLELLAGPAGFPLRRGALALRAAVDRVYAGSLRPLHRAVLNGLVFGDTAALPPEILRRFADAGAVHLLSVSGLHVGFVILLVLGAARALGRRGWGAWIAAAAAVAGYAILCGAKPPVVRAAVMGLAAGAGGRARRRAEPANLLGLAALVVLAWQPWALGTLSFQLTFAACAGLVFLYPRWAEWTESYPPAARRAARSVLVSLAATLAVLPLQIGAFGRLSLVGPLANLILVPLAGLAVQAGLAAGLLGTVLPFTARPFLAGLDLFLGLFLAAARCFAALPGAAVNVGAWPAPLVVCFYLLLGMVGWGMERNALNRRPRLPVGRMAAIVAAAAAILVWWRVLAAPSGLSVTFLDVGQGDSILVRSPDGRTMLVDGGEEEAGPRVLSYLRRLGVNRLDLMVVSHPHSDHVGGLAAVAEEIPVGHVLDPGWPHPAETYRRFLLVLKERRIPWRRARRGLSFTLGREVLGEVLHPLPGMEPPEDWNDGSLVLRLRYGRFTLLLPGDLTREGEEAVLAAGGDLRATVLKVAHHGSATSTGEAWLAAVGPRAAVISVGWGNQFGHPSGEVLARLAAAGVKVYRTDERGTVRVTSDGRGYRVETARRR